MKPEHCDADFGNQEASETFSESVNRRKFGEKNSVTILGSFSMVTPFFTLPRNPFLDNLRDWNVEEKNSHLL